MFLNVEVILKVIIKTVVSVFIIPTINGVIKGSWSEWSGWSSCSISCNVASSSRTRNCFMQNFGLKCTGNKKETKSCPTIIGNWNKWSNWSICVSCRKKRTRSCSTNCSNCIGSNTQTMNCSCIPENMLYGDWGDWESWSICNQSTGLTNRIRYCDTLLCIGNDTEEIACDITENMLYGDWGDWESWSICNQSTGLTNRIRYCDTLLCIGNDTEEIACDITEILLPGVWGDWGSWSTCNQSTGLINRIRYCNDTFCIGNNTEENACSCINQSVWNVSNSVSIIEYSITLSLQINRLCETQEIVRVEFEYFLPPFFTFLSENVIQSFVKIDVNRLNYIFNGKFTATDSFDHKFKLSYNDSTCPLSGLFTLDIPFKFAYQIGFEKRIDLKKNFQKNVECFINPKKPITNPILKESYGRGIYWDSVEKHIYVCMNQHYASTTVACYYSNNNGYLWDSLDVQVGSVIGHHSKTRELYAVHRNRKTYLVFNKTQKRWFALTNEGFMKTAINDIDPYLQRNLEGDYEQIHVIGLYQWRANAEGLFFRKSEEDSWIQRVKWRL